MRIAITNSGAGGNDNMKNRADRTDGMAPKLAPLWADTAPAAPTYPALAGPVDADVAIIGAGFTGLSTALALAEHGRSAVVLEAGQPGSGASGVSGGQVIPGLRHFDRDLIAAYGTEAGQRAHRFGGEAADRAFAVITRHDIPCDAAQTGKIQVADSPAGLADAVRRVAAWETTGAPVEMLDRTALAERIGTDAYLGGWVDARGGTVQPLALTQGLAAAATRLGARIFGDSAALRIVRDGGDWRVETASGAVRARQLLIATNATTGKLWPGLDRSFMPVWSYQIATEPLGERLPSPALRGGSAVSDTRRVIRYFRSDTEGRLIVGGKGTAHTPRKIGDFDFQRRLLERLYPSLADIPLGHAWGGQVAITIDRLPRVFALGPGAYAHIGCNGKGVAWCTAIGEAFAEAFISDRADALPLPATPVSPIPLHQFRKLYVALGGAWLRLRDTLDTTGAASAR